MSDSEFQELKGDISGSGLLEPIVMFEGKILDGRHRYKACLQLGIEPWFKDYDGPDSALDYVISLNLRRRHLSESQRAMAMANLCGLLRGRPKQAEAIDGEFEEINVSRDTFMTRTEAAEKAGVSEANFLHAGNLEEASSIREALRLPRHAHGCTKQWPRVIQGWCAVQNILKLFQLVVVQFLDPAAESCRR
jgi:hypothetical protein